MELLTNQNFQEKRAPTPAGITQPRFDPIITYPIMLEKMATVRENYVSSEFKRRLNYHLDNCSKIA
jgi:hypothetical protein